MSGKSDRWEFYTDKRGQHRWRRVAQDGEIVGASPYGYSSKWLAEANAERHGYKGNPSNIGAGDKWEIFRDKQRKYRWRRTAANGEVVGESSEGYRRREDCEDNALRNGYKPDNPHTSQIALLKA